MKPECPWYIPPKLYVDPEIDEDVEGSAMCDLTDKYCLVEYGSDCQVYNDFLKEVEDES